MKTYFVTIHGKCNNCSTAAIIATLVPEIGEPDALGTHRRFTCEGCGQGTRGMVVGHTLYPFVARPDVEQ